MALRLFLFFKISDVVTAVCEINVSIQSNFHVWHFFSAVMRIQWPLGGSADAVWWSKANQRREIHPAAELLWMGNWKGFNKWSSNAKILPLCFIERLQADLDLSIVTHCIGSLLGLKILICRVTSPFKGSYNSTVLYTAICITASNMTSVCPTTVFLISLG